MKRPALLLAGLAALAGPLTGLADAQERPRDERGTVDFTIRDVAPEEASYLPQPWEALGPVMPPLEEGAVVATSVDDTQLRFVTGGELGTFRPAPPGGTPFFGSGQPIFGVGAPPILPSRVLRPLGSGDTGDRFLGERPPLDQTTVIPKLSATFDERRESFAFIGEIPPIPDETSGTPPFPSSDVLAADAERGVPDNRPRPPVTTPPDTTPPVTTPGTRPETPPGVPSTSPTTVPVTTTTTPTPTTAPSPGTTTTTVPTTTTAPTTTTTTVPTATTTTAPTTTTTQPPTTTTTTTTPPVTTPPDPPPVVGTSFVLGNQREDAGFCYSNGSGGTHKADCDKLFEFGDTGGAMTPGRVYAVDLTLWNVAGLSDTDAVDLRAYAAAACTSTATPGSPADLCEAIEVTIQRYTSSSRTTPAQCVYGGGTSSTCSFSSTRTFGHYGRTHTSLADGAKVVPGLFRINDKAYLRISVRLPDRGIDGDGIGRENVFLGHGASLVFRWGMQSA